MNDWNDFTRSNYRRLLNLASRRYRLAPVIEWDRDGVNAVWRHDIDVSPQSALATARIEQLEGVRATYFVNLRSEFYSLFEANAARALKEIHALGHEIGIHLDASQVDVSSAQSLEGALGHEASMIRAALGVEPLSFSFHNPDDRTKAFRAASYAGIVNSYSQELMTGFAYCSDSNGHWRFTPLEDFLNAGHASIYVLTHPDWWQDQPMSPRDRIVRAVEGRAAAVLRDYDDLLERHGRKNLRA